MTATFLDLPDEVLICIARHTEIEDVLSLRETCRRCFHLTHERSIWETILLDQSTTYPIPGHGTHRGLQLSNTETRDIEALATSVYTTATSWLHKRPHTLSLLPEVLSEWHSGSGGGGALARLDHRSIQDMHMLLDRWLVVVFQEGCYELWDLYPADTGDHDAGLSSKGGWAKKKKRVRPVCVLQERVHGAFISSAACVDPEDEAIVLALSSQPVIMIVKINLKANPKHLQPELVASVGTTPFSIYIMRAISPTSKLLVFGFALNLHFWHWPTDSYWEVKLDENEDEIYNMVIATHFLTPHHLLCLLNSSIELLTLDFLHETNDVPSSRNDKTLRMDSLNFRGRRHPHCMQLPHPNPVDLVTVRGAVFSEPKMVVEEDKRGATCRTTFLAYNVLRGLFHYGVEVRFSLEPSQASSSSTSTSSAVNYEFADPPLDFTLNLLAAHHMAQYVPSSSSSNTDPPPTTTSQLQSASGYTPQGGTRGFISTCALGAQGMRGVWVERHRTSMGRSVFGFASRDYAGMFDNQAEAESTAKMNPAEKPYAAIASTCIHEMKSSYDLRGGLPDDLTHCALSEVTGSVVLGTRRGELIVL